MKKLQFARTFAGMRVYGLQFPPCPFFAGSSIKLCNPTFPAAVGQGRDIGGRRKRNFEMSADVAVHQAHKLI
jgi:hypothetical protein